MRATRRILLEFRSTGVSDTWKPFPRQLREPSNVSMKRRIQSCVDDSGVLLKTLANENPKYSVRTGKIFPFVFLLNQLAAVAVIHSWSTNYQLRIWLLEFGTWLGSLAIGHSKQFQG